MFEQARDNCRYNIITHVVKLILCTAAFLIVFFLNVYYLNTVSLFNTNTRLNAVLFLNKSKCYNT